MVEISLWLFGKPEWEIDLEKVKPKEIKELGEELKLRLENVSEILKKLEKNGWERSGGLYDIFLYKDISKKEAEKKLKKLGIKNIEIIEVEDD